MSNEDLVELLINEQRFKEAAELVQSMLKVLNGRLLGIKGLDEIREKYISYLTELS